MIRLEVPKRLHGTCAPLAGRFFLQVTARGEGFFDLLVTLRGGVLLSARSRLLPRSRCFARLFGAGRGFLSAGRRFFASGSPLFLLVNCLFLRWTHWVASPCQRQGDCHGAGQECYQGRNPPFG